MPVLKTVLGFISVEERSEGWTEREDDRRGCHVRVNIPGHHPSFVEYGNVLFIGMLIVANSWMFYATFSIL